MKRSVLLLLAALLFSSLNTIAFAETPKLIVEEYDIAGDCMIPGEITALTVIFQNTSSKHAIRNIKLSFKEESGQVFPVGMGTQFVKSIERSKQYEWQFDIFAIKTAESRPYTATVIMEYEDSNSVPVTMTDSIYLYVHQSVRLEYGKIDFPPRLTQTDSVPFSVALMNMGKSNILNALLTYDIPGLTNGSGVLVGKIEPGESKTGTANFRVNKDVSGEVSGSLTISYEDEYGETYKKEISISTVIEEKAAPPKAPAQAEANGGERDLRMIYGLAGFIVVSISAIFIKKYIRQRKQIKADEMRL